MKPNIIILGTGHSGSSVLGEMILRLGWQIKDSKSRFRAEYRPMRNLNQRVLEGEDVIQDECLNLLNDLSEPWMLKDPRFSVTLNYWNEAWKKYYGNSKRGLLLLWLERNFEDTKKSYLKRNEYRMVNGYQEAYEKVSGISLAYAYDNCSCLYDEWQWSKIKIGYEDIKNAVSIFGTERDREDHPMKGKCGWE